MSSTQYVDSQKFNALNNITIEELNVTKLTINSEEIVTTLNIKRVEQILESMSNPGIKRLLENIDEIKDLIEKTLLLRI